MILKLTSPPILAFADLLKPFIVNIDASKEGLVAALYQNQEGLDRVIAYASRRLRSGERNYPAHKLELLCLKLALCDKFHDYLYGNTFEVFTDNNPLTYVTTTAKLIAMSHRWLASLSNYNCKLHYKTGKSNRAADGLSRLPAEIFPNVIKALTSAVLVGKEELPLAESIVLSENATLERASEDKEMQEFGSIYWAFEQRKDAGIKGAIEILETGFKLFRKELKCQHVEVREYLRKWKHFEVCKNVLFHHIHSWMVKP